jgi:2-polyprenyl-3-methyl-5-hydroxy-6-metoxy-1,4-benzoquinol methylase
VLLDRTEEYEKMAKVEKSHWLCRTLHNLVLDFIRRYRQNRDIVILDAGCGTGGLMHFLRGCGYRNLKGVDVSNVAVKWCHRRNLDV